MSKILVIDDNLEICTLLKSFLKRKDFDVETASTGHEGLKKMKDFNPNIILCDFRLPDKDGLEMIREIKSHDSSIQVIIITGYGDVRLAVKAIKVGAFEYVTKPIFPEEILMTIKEAEKKALSGSTEKTTKKKVVKKNTSLKKYNTQIIKGNSERSKHLYSLIELVAPTNMTVMILGESGTGKEVTAKQIHALSNRAKKPFVAVDCGALPENIAGSELFGHIKGAFTGALKDKKGFFEQANGGTLFLDEIGNLTYENQVKLLRVLQERVIRRLGDEKDIKVDVRIIVATNDELKKKVHESEFREDLYYRLNEFKLELPALRERTNDIEDFIKHFINLSNGDLDKDVKHVDKKVLQKFKTYHWPGNIRELRNVIKRAVLLTQENVIKEIHIPQEILTPKILLADIMDDEDNEVSDLKSVVEKAEKKAILKVLKQTSYNRTRASELLNVDRKTLYNKIKSYGLD